MNPIDLNQRIITLESQLAYAEYNIEKLSQELAAHQKKMQRLHQRTAQMELMWQNQTATSESAPNPVHEVPPHY